MLILEDREVGSSVSSVEYDGIPFMELIMFVFLCSFLLLLADLF